MTNLTKSEHTVIVKKCKEIFDYLNGIVSPNISKNISYKIPMGHNRWDLNIIIWANRNINNISLGYECIHATQFTIGEKYDFYNKGNRVDIFTRDEEMLAIASKWDDLKSICEEEMKNKSAIFRKSI